MPAVRPKIIFRTSRGDAATFGTWTAAPAGLLRQRKVFRIYAAPKRAMTETERNKRRKGPRVTGYMHGMPPAKIQGQRKVILAHVGYLRAARPPRHPE